MFCAFCFRASHLHIHWRKGSLPASASLDARLQFKVLDLLPSAGARGLLADQALANVTSRSLRQPAIGHAPPRERKGSCQFRRWRINQTSCETRKPRAAKFTLVVLALNKKV